MNKYRDFQNDPDRFPYDKMGKFLERVHKNNQHFVPIVDAAIYSPGPDDPEDEYPTYDRGVEAKAFVMNPDGSLYVGQVWPGNTGRSSFP
jgi:alpha-glucosidase